MANKGSNFEREICKLLSLWWTNNKRDDVFWRTSGSGARATTRSKTKQKTFGQYGDVQATDPIGQPLIDLCTIELKRGYSKSTFADLIEESQTANAKPCAYYQFIKQARQDHNKAGSLSWMLIIKRDRRKPIIIIPSKLHGRIEKIDNFIDIRLSVHARIKIRKLKGSGVYIYPLADFLSYVKPKVMKRIHRK